MGAFDLGDRARAEVKYSGRYKGLVDGTLSVEDLTTEELSKGRLMDKNGRFTGRPPKFLPRQLVDAMRTEHHRRVNAALEESLSDTVKTMRMIMNDISADPATRLRAAIYVYERFMGKTPDRIEVKRGDKVDAVIDKIMYDMGESPIEKEIAETEAEMNRPPATRRRGRVATSRTNGHRPKRD
jgi:hypothetical protein